MIKVEDSKITFDSVYHSEYAPDDTEFQNANILLIPFQNYRDDIDFCFAESTEELLNYLKMNSSSGIIADIAIRDDQFQIITLHSKKIDLGKILISVVVVPMGINLLSNFLYDKVALMHEDREHVDVSVEIIVEDKNGISKSIKYDGPASEFDEIEVVIEDVLKEDEIE